MLLIIFFKYNFLANNYVKFPMQDLLNYSKVLREIDRLPANEIKYI